MDQLNTCFWDAICSAPRNLPAMAVMTESMPCPARLGQFALFSSSLPCPTSISCPLACCWAAPMGRSDQRSFQPRLVLDALPRNCIRVNKPNKSISCCHTQLQTLESWKGGNGALRRQQDTAQVTHGFLRARLLHLSLEKSLQVTALDDVQVVLVVKAVPQRTGTYLSCSASSDSSLLSAKCNGPNAKCFSPGQNKPGHVYIETYIDQYTYTHVKPCTLLSVSVKQRQSWEDQEGKGWVHWTI